MEWVQRWRRMGSELLLVALLSVFIAPALLCLAVSNLCFGMAERLARNFILVATYVRSLGDRAFMMASLPILLSVAAVLFGLLWVGVRARNGAAMIARLPLQALGGVSARDAKIARSR